MQIFVAHTTDIQLQNYTIQSVYSTWMTHLVVLFASPLMCSQWTDAYFKVSSSVVQEHVFFVVTIQLTYTCGD